MTLAGRPLPLETYANSRSDASLDGACTEREQLSEFTYSCLSRMYRRVRAISVYWDFRYFDRTFCACTVQWCVRTWVSTVVWIVSPKFSWTKWAASSFRSLSCFDALQMSPSDKWEILISIIKTVRSIDWRLKSGLFCSKGTGIKYSTLSLNPSVKWIS